MELFRWWRKWLNADQDLPSSADQALEECNHEFFPNVHKLLRILCRWPITSEECERSFSTLQRLKTHLRATMTSERESGLALMNIHYGRQIGIGATIDIFAKSLQRCRLWKFVLGIKETPFLKTQNSNIFRGNMPPAPPSKERLRRSIVNRASSIH